MNILLTMTEIVILAPLKPYIRPSFVHFLALETKNFIRESFKTKWPIKVRYQLVLGILGFIGLQINILLTMIEIVNLAL